MYYSLCLLGGNSLDPYICMLQSPCNLLMGFDNPLTSNKFTLHLFLCKMSYFVKKILHFVVGYNIWNCNFCDKF